MYDGTARRRATHNNTAVTLRIQNTVGRLTQQSKVGLGYLPPSRDSTDAAADISDEPTARQAAFPGSRCSSPRRVWRASFAFATSGAPQKPRGSLRGSFASWHRRDCSKIRHKNHHYLGWVFGESIHFFKSHNEGRSRREFSSPRFVRFRGETGTSCGTVVSPTNRSRHDRRVQLSAFTKDPP